MGLSVTEMAVSILSLGKGKAELGSSNAATSDGKPIGG